MLVAENPLMDLGDIKFGQVYKFTFKVRNEGPKPIKIKKIAVSCSACTVATMHKTVIDPQATEMVYVTFTPGSVSKQKKSVQLLYDDKSLLLKFQGVST